ncbi:hypothetical protein THIOM_002219 [Candidatus Thiomargarita nelsonii]|uniref:Uncharacterized protein n=1 Tax=Candidatus Thiomargarita nelsonii TaxID=1003181 RepID=A0A176S263_9GAMM|nr:hypothetical protein THIOM_002219 [Candidatus Thiomargarita nelsonii]
MIPANVFILLDTNIILQLIRKNIVDKMNELLDAIDVQINNFAKGNHKGLPLQYNIAM